MQGIGRERPAGEIAPIGTYGATFSGSPCSVPLHPAGSAHGRLSQGSYIPFLYGQGLEKWIRLPEARAMGALWAGPTGLLD